MNFEDIKKIVDKEGKIVLIDSGKTYIISQYNPSLDEGEKSGKVKELEGNSKEIQEDHDEPLKIEDLPF